MRTTPLLLIALSSAAHAQTPSDAGARTPSDAEVEPAGAQPPPRYTRTVTLGLASQTIGRDAQAAATASAEASARGHFHDGSLGEAAADASAELRGGAAFEAAAQIGGHAAIGYDLGDDDSLPMLAVWGSASLGNRPALAAPRDVARETYARTDIGFRLMPLFAARGTGRGGMLRFGFGGSLVWQGDRERALISGELGGYERCYVHPGEPASCIRVLDFRIEGLSGGKEAVVSDMTLLRVSGLGAYGVYLDAGFGLVGNGGSIGIDDRMDPGPEDEVVTEDLPAITLLSANVGVTAQAGRLRAELRGKRSGYLSLDSELSIDDRVTLSGTLPVGRVGVTASGFAARTRWWATKQDPGRTGATWGGDLTAALRVHGFDVSASAGVARSFYPVLDGAAADDPSVGLRSTLQVARTIDL